MWRDIQYPRERQWALYQKGFCKIKGGQATEAFTIWQRLRMFYPQSPLVVETLLLEDDELVRRLALCQISLGQEKEAFALLQQAAQKLPTPAPPLLGELVVQAATVAKWMIYGCK